MALQSEQRTLEEDIGRMRKEVIRLELNISKIPSQSALTTDLKNKLISEIKAIRKKMGGNPGPQNMDLYRKQCMGNLSRELESISTEMNSFQEDLLKYMYHFADKVE